jgi:hypothetical protein
MDHTLPISTDTISGNEVSNLCTYAGRVECVGRRSDSVVGQLIWERMGWGPRSRSPNLILTDQ